MGLYTRRYSIASHAVYVLPLNRRKFFRASWDWTLDFTAVPNLLFQVVESRDNLWTKAANHFKNGFSVNFQQIELLFSQMSPQNTLERQKTETSAVPDTPTEKKKLDQVNLLGPKRSLNVNIFLKQFRGYACFYSSCLLACNLQIIKF